MQTRRDIDLLRLVSAFGIVWYHSGVKGHETAYGALIAFIVISVYLAAMRAPSGEFIFRRVRRLLVPWMAWYSIYLILNLVMRHPPLPYGDNWAARLLAGPSYHLWYMPFIFSCLLAFDFLRLRLAPAPLGAASALIAAMLLGTTVWWRSGSKALGYPFAQYIHALAAVFVGIFLSYFDHLSRRYRSCLLALLLLAALMAVPYAGVGLPYLVGIGAGAIVAMRLFDTVGGGLLARTSEYTLGVYFVHVLVLNFAFKYLRIHDAIIPLFVFLVSLFIIYSIKIISPRYSRYLL